MNITQQVQRTAFTSRRSAAPFKGAGFTGGARAVRAAARYKVVDDTPLDLGSLVKKQDTPAPVQAEAVPSSAPVAPEPSAPTPAAVQAPAPVTTAAQDASAAPVPEPAATPVELPPVPSAEELFNNLNEVSNQATDAITSAASDVTEAASALASGAGEAVTGITDAVSGIGDALSGGVDALTGSVSSFGGSLTGSVTGLGGAVTDGVDSIGGAFSGSVGAATQEASQAVQAVSGAVTDAVGGALSSVTGVFSGASSALSGTVGEGSRVAGDALSTVTGAVTDVTSTVTGAVSDVTSSINAAAGTAAATVTSYVQEVDAALGGVRDQVWGSIPPPAQAALAEVGSVVGAAASLAIEYPLPVLAVAGAVTVPSVINSYSRRFGGFAGELPAEEVSALLSSDSPALLLDIRNPIIREKDGLPELKLGARFKAAALPLAVAQQQVAQCDPRLLRQLNKEELTYAIHAAFAANLKQVSTALAKVVVMDREGSDEAREVARALRREGIFSAYIMQDGYKGWVAAELPTTTQRGIEYDASAADLINDNIEVITQKAVSLASRLKDPAVAVPVAGTTALGAVSLYYYETTLQVIGLAGMSWSLYSELSKYDSPQEAFEAWTSGIKKLVTPKPKPVMVNGKPVPEGFVPPRLPAPAAAARADEVLARAAKEAEEERKRAVAAAAAAQVQKQQAAAATAVAATQPAPAAPAASKAAPAAAPSTPAAPKPAAPAANSPSSTPSPTTPSQPQQSQEVKSV